MNMLKLFSVTGSQPTHKLILEGIPNERLTVQQANIVFKTVREKYKVKASKMYIMLVADQVFVFTRVKKDVYKIFDLSGEP